ncbi:hypothetical protein BHE74_00015647 [Ensete ventricosum]|nr:hypothetical protein BHE74_00015647 [Ensete ventricosum]
MCVGSHSARKQWLAAPSPMDARLRAATGYGCCNTGERGHVRGAPQAEGDDDDKGGRWQRRTEEEGTTLVRAMVGLCEDGCKI